MLVMLNSAVRWCFPRNESRGFMERRELQLPEARRIWNVMLVVAGEVSVSWKICEREEGAGR